MGDRGPESRTAAGSDARAVAEAVHRASVPDPVAHVLGRLGRGRGELAAALAGEGLQVRLVVGAGGSESVHLLVFASDGAVLRVRSGGALADVFEPDVTVRGSGEEVLALVLGEIDVSSALERGLLVLHVPPESLVPRYARLIRLLGACVLEMASEATMTQPRRAT